jgi:diacylglycerol O-acyltransferase / wax synthase
MTEPFDCHMSDADALMWNVERDPHLRSTIVTALVLDRAPEWERLLERIERGTRLIPRMRERVVMPPMRIGPPAWSADPDFDLAYHVRRMRAPKPRSFDCVLDVAATSAMGDFDHTRPLWECTLIEGLPEGGAAFVIKLHHSMTDGVGGMKLLLMLFDLERDGNGADGGAADPEPLALTALTPMALVGRSLDWQRRRFAETARGVVGAGRSAWRDVRDDTFRAVDGALRTAGSVARWLAPAPEPMSPLMQARSLDRRLATLDAPLDDLKRAAKAVGGTVNDAFVAGVMGGLRRYHEERGATCDELRMIMPINLRGEGSGLGGNHFTLARLPVPVGLEDPAQRVQEVGARLRRLRDEPAVAVADAIPVVLNRLPRRIATPLLRSMLKGGDFITSNVPGAPFPIYMAGAEVQQLYAFAPLSGTPANITLLSHCGTCCIGINTDPRAIPDTAGFSDAIRAGIAEILALG